MRQFPFRQFVPACGFLLGVLICASCSWFTDSGQPAGRPADVIAHSSETVDKGSQGNGVFPAESHAAGTESAQPTLSFRAIIRDESRDQILQQEESLTIEIEVKNDGPVEAKGVEVVIEGTPVLTAEFPRAVAIGDLQPGEIKRTAITKRVPDLKMALRGELILRLHCATPVGALPTAKKFALTIRQENTNGVHSVVDVNPLPKPAAAFRQPESIIIAIGVGQFRDESVPSVKYAGRDAEAVAGYLRAIGSIPEDRVRVLIGPHALKQDLVAAFDEWLPQRVNANTVVYVFFSGRALVDGVTGAVSLVPFDATTTAVSRLYSVRRLQESLARVPIQRAILMFDVSLDPLPGADHAVTAHPKWDVVGGSDQKNQIMLMVGNAALQEAHAYEEARHGLFTYQILRGLQGVADADRDGTVVAGELCNYARGQVARIAKEQYGNEQNPLCLPPTGQGAMVRIHPLAKGDNPKPVAVTNKSEPDPEPASDQATKPKEVGPGQ